MESVGKATSRDGKSGREGKSAAASKGDEKSNARRSRGTRAGAKRRLEAGQKQQQQQQQQHLLMLRYDRDSLLRLKDSRLSSAWPRALDKSFVGDSGLWDPVKLFDDERKTTTEVRHKVERNRGGRGGGQAAYPGAAEESPFGRSRRRKRNNNASGTNKEDSGVGIDVPRRQLNTDCHQLRSKSDSEKENRRQAAVAASASTLSSGAVGKAGVKQAVKVGREPNRRSGQELPAWFDEGPLDKMETLELTGLPEDEESNTATTAMTKSTEGVGAPTSLMSCTPTHRGSRLSEWIGDSAQSKAALERLIFKDLNIHQPQQQQQERPPQQQQQERQPQQQQQQRQLQDRQQHQHRQQQQQTRPAEVEAGLKSLLFGATRPTPSSTSGVGASAMPPPPSGQVKTLQEIENSLGAKDDARDANDNRALYRLIGELQARVRESNAAQPHATVEARQRPLGVRPQQPQQQVQQFMQQHQQFMQQQQQQQAFPGQSRFPMPLQPQQLQQLQAILLSNLQMQAQLLHTGQLAPGVNHNLNSRKANPISKLLPQPLFYSSPKPPLFPSNAMHSSRLLNQQFGDAPDAFAAVKRLGESNVPMAYRGQQAASVASPSRPCGAASLPTMSNLPSSLAHSGGFRGVQSGQQSVASLWQPPKLPGQSAWGLALGTEGQRQPRGQLKVGANDQFSAI